jgi:hypothetical protein
MRVLVLYPDLFASPIVNILTPLQWLEAQGHLTLSHCREDEVTPDQVANSTIIIACRSVDPAFRPIYDYALALGKPIIYDLDDNLFAVPSDSSLYRYFAHPDKQAQLRWLLQQASLVRVHSPRLAEVVRPYNEHVQVVWAVIDWSLAPPELPTLKQNPLEIVYAVSPGSGAMFMGLIRDDLAHLLRDFPSEIRFSLWGYHDKHLAKYPNYQHRPFVADYAAFFREFTQYGYAIGLAPMKQDVFYECKTDLKFRDYAAAGIVGVYSNSPLYSVVQHGITGFLVENAPGTWYQTIVALLQEPACLEPIRQAARQVAFERYHVTQVAQQWLTDLHSLPIASPTNAVILPSTWPVARPAQARKPSQWQAWLKRQYDRWIPFSWHIHLSRLYHQLKR